MPSEGYSNSITYGSEPEVEVDSTRVMADWSRWEVRFWVRITWGSGSDILLAVGADYVTALLLCQSCLVRTLRNCC